MPIYNPCPPSDESYCFNGGDCFYIPEDPTLYICSCFMPYYGPRCEHEAPKQAVIPTTFEDSNGRRSVDRALIICALVFVVIIFVGAVMLTFYWALKRRSNVALPWKGKKLHFEKHHIDTGGKSECGVQASFGDSDVPFYVSNQSASMEHIKNVPYSLSNRTLSIDPSGEGQTDCTECKQDTEEILRDLKEPYLLKRIPQASKRPESSNSVQNLAGECRERISSRLVFRTDSRVGSLFQPPRREYYQDQNYCMELTDSESVKVRECLQIYGDERASIRPGLHTKKKRPKNGKLEESLVKLPPKSHTLRINLQPDHTRNNSNENDNNPEDEYPETFENECKSSSERKPYADHTCPSDLSPFDNQSYSYHTWSPTKPPCTFIVASEHDALLSDLFSRGQHLRDQEMS